ncbi:FabD/lysophospholipase-like protein [Xylariaceae sp. AK1471]|nr:FabD/lysophospholipase-like protein [Xylariaceae sp. AK1471]
MATLNPVEDSAPLKLLSIDGGGIRGISTLIILKYLMKRINPTNPPKPCDYFDLIGGTSTGGIIALMLGRLRMNVQECIDKYIELSSAAFTPKRSKANALFKIKDKWDVTGSYRSDILVREMRQAVQDYLGSRDPEAMLHDLDPACKVFVCAFTKARSTPILLRSYTTEDSIDFLSGSNCTIWQAARATSAAATFFDPIQIGRQTFVDGATGMNNPVEQVLEEAKSIWPDAIAKGRIQCLLSIGTGVPDLKKFGDNLKEVIETLKRIATETENTERRFFKTHEFLGLGGRYFRFNVDRGISDVQLDDHGKLAEIEASAEEYLGNPRVRALIDNFLKARAPMVCASTS